MDSTVGVYCKNCKYHPLCDEIYAPEHCKATYTLTADGYKDYNMDRSIRNQNHNCEYYKRKGWKFWI